MEQLARTQVNLREMSATAAANTKRHDREIAEIRATLRRAIRLSVEEQRRERVRRQELDGKITQLASAQLLNEEATRNLQAAMERFLDRWRDGGGNGGRPA